MAMVTAQSQKSHPCKNMAAIATDILMKQSPKYSHGKLTQPLSSTAAANSSVHRKLS